MKVEDTAPESIRGWECTPTGGQPDVAESSEKSQKITCLSTIFRDGWRRTSLYAIIVFLMFLIFLNIALTLWIISTLRLTKNGIGPIVITRDGIRLDGKVWMMDDLVASTITSQTAQPLTIHSYRNFTILVTNSKKNEQSKFLIKRDTVECSGQVFEVRDANGGDVFHASKEEVRVFAHALAVDGPGGVTIKSALQTPLVHAPPGFDLHLESLTRRLDLRAPQSIYLESRAGGIEIMSHSNIKLDSVVGSIRMDAPNIVINNLKEGTISQTAQRNMKGKKVYQLCACATGKLFLAAPDALCSMYESDLELCR